MAKKKRTEEEILADLKNYKPKMTEGEEAEVFCAKMQAGLLKKEAKNTMQSKNPSVSHFVFDRKTWEVKNEFKVLSEESRCSKITFESIFQTGLVDPEIGYMSV